MKLNVGRYNLSETVAVAILINRARSPSGRLIILLTPVNRVVCIHRRDIVDSNEFLEDAQMPIQGRATYGPENRLLKHLHPETSSSSFLRIVFELLNILWIANHWTDSDLTQRTLLFNTRIILGWSIKFWKKHWSQKKKIEKQYNGLYHKLLFAHFAKNYLNL